jgi:hypothetical protein
MLITPRMFSTTTRPTVSFETITKLRGAQFGQLQTVGEVIGIVDDF